MKKVKPLLLHGSAKIASRKKLIDLKQQFDPNSVSVYEEGSNTKDILGEIMTMPLFEQDRLIILENPPEDLTFDKLVTSLIVWYEKEISDKKPIHEYFKKNGQVLYFPEAKERSIFPFLDMLVMGDSKAYLELEQLKLNGFEIQYFITMIFYQLRNLAATPGKAPQFVKEKLARQRQRLPLEKVRNLYKEILEIDFKIKSGLLEPAQAEFLLVQKLLN